MISVATWIRQNGRLDFACLFIDLREHFLKDKASQTRRRVERRQRKRRDRQRHEPLCHRKGKTELRHEYADAVGKHIDRTARFEQFGELIAADISRSDDRNDRQHALDEHTAISDCLGVFFIVQLLGACARTNEGMKSGNRSAGHRHEQHREQQIPLPHIERRHRRELHLRLVENDADESE